MQAIDTRVRVETPESVNLELNCAGLCVRAMAFAIDMAIKAVILLASAVILPGVLGKVGSGIHLVVFFLLMWFYGVFFEVLKNGQTPGKKRCGIRVVQCSGLPLTLKAAIVRNFLRDIDFLPLFYGAGIVSMLSNSRFQRIGDIVADTVVVYDQQVASVSMPDIKPAYLPLPLDGDQQAAIISLAERHQLLTQERQIEMANILGPVIGKQDEAALKALQAHASWLTGKAL